MMSYWSDLPEDIVECILKRINTPTYHLNFAAVCKWWYSVSVQNRNRFPENLPICHYLPQACPLPMLLIPSGNGLNTSPYLYSITEKKTYNCFSESLFPDKWIPGSARGWLITVDTKGKSINLLNPLTAKQIALPDLTTFDKPFSESNHHEAENGWYVQKATVLFDASGKPEDSVFVTVISTQKRICFCRFGDNNWTTIDRSPVHIYDVMNFKGKLWAVDHVGKLFAIEIGRTHTKWTMIVGQIKSMGAGEIYLVESRGEILMVFRGTVEDERTDRFQVFSYERTDRFHVFRLVKSASKYAARYWLEDGSRHKVKGLQYEWVEVESIGEEMIFLGYNHSLSLDSRAYPGCQGNCIYFADHLSDPDMYRFFHGGDPKSHDIGVYHLQDKRVESFERLGDLSSHHALWLSPNGW